MEVPATIVTITYNSSKFVKHAIESVLAQSYTNFEYIICDDCSTDNTWEIIQEYKDQRIKAIRNEQNIGEYPNRNKTLNLAKGKYILWIDGDDILYPHGLEFMVKMLDAFPESAMALVNEYRKDIIYPYELSPEEIYRYDFLGKPVTHYGLPYTLFKTKILTEVGGFSENYIAGDTYIKRLISKSHKSVLISDGLSWWRQPKGQASSRLKVEMAGDIENMKMSEKLLFSKQCPLSEAELKTVLRNIYGGFIRKLIYKYIFRLKFYKGLTIFKLAGLRFLHLKFIFYRLKYNFTNNSSSEHPLIIEISKNPYSSK